MRFDERFMDELKSRLRLSEVIGKTVQLRRQGREFVGLSPFNKERTPSFFVNDDKGFYHDFSSGKHGDLISFLQETEGLSFAEAVERLAGEAGLALPVDSPEAEARGKRRQSLSDWLDLAATWFEGELRRPGGREAALYLERRGLPAPEWARFRLGYAPGGRTGLKDYLVAKGASPADLVAAGLLISPEEGGAPFDRFRERVMFPIIDGRGRVLSFGGRALSPEARAKYLNGPETDLFDKGAVLYGIGEARRLLREAGEGAVLVVVEGYMDVIACQRAGVAAVAAMGTGLTEMQMEQLWRLHSEPTLCFDADRAGRQAASRAMDRALPRLAPGRSFRFAALQGGKDPDEIMREQGPAALRSQLASSEPFVDALFARERDAEPLETPERQAGLRQRLRRAAEAISDRDLSSAYRQSLMARLDQLLGDRRALPAPRAMTRLRGLQPGPPVPESRAAAHRLARALDPVAAALALHAIADPHLVETHLEEIQEHGFGDPALGALTQEMVKEIIRRQGDGADLDSGHLKRHLADCGFDALLIDAHGAAAKSGAPFFQDAVDVSVARSQWSNGFLAVSRAAALDAAMALAKQGLTDVGQARALMALKQERDALRRAIAARSLWSD